MNVNTLKNKLRGLPVGTCFTADKIVLWLEMLESGTGGHGEDPARVTAPSGPGKASYPCPCGKGQLLMKVNMGIQARSGRYARIRVCNCCKKKFKTVELLESEMPAGDLRAGEWRLKTNAGKRKGAAEVEV